MSMCVLLESHIPSLSRDCVLLFYNHIWLYGIVNAFEDQENLSFRIYYFIFYYITTVS